MSEPRGEYHADLGPDADRQDRIDMAVSRLLTALRPAPASLLLLVDLLEQILDDGGYGDITITIRDSRVETIRKTGSYKPREDHGKHPG